MDSDLYISINDLKNRMKRDQTSPSETLWKKGPRSNRPVALLFRQIASPSFEVHWFLRKASRYNFEPIILEHTGDLFSVHNPFKRALIDLPVVVGLDRRGNSIIRRQKIANHDESEGRPLKFLKVRNGETLVNYHHRKLVETFGSLSPRTIDLVDIVPDTSKGAMGYYPDLFRLLVGNTMLFEDFVVDRQTAKFFIRIVLPTYRDAVNSMPIRPQIAKLTYGRRAALSIWNAYPSSVADDRSWLGGSLQYAFSA